MPRAIPREIGVIVELILHGFADVSFLRCCVIVYVIVKQPGTINQELLISKVRLLKPDLTIPQLELRSPSQHTHFSESSTRHWCLRVDWLYSLSSMNSRSRQINTVRCEPGAKDKREKKSFGNTFLASKILQTSAVGDRVIFKLTKRGWMVLLGWIHSKRSYPMALFWQIIAKQTDASESGSRQVKTAMKSTVHKRLDFVDNALAKETLWKNRWNVGFIQGTLSLNLQINKDGI